MNPNFVGHFQEKVLKNASIFFLNVFQHALTVLIEEGWSGLFFIYVYKII